MIYFEGLFDECWTEVYEVRSHWDSEKIRRLLIGMVAGALEQLTRSENGGAFVGSDSQVCVTMLNNCTGNCFDMAGTKGCNVGDVVRVSPSL